MYLAFFFLESVLLPDIQLLRHGIVGFGRLLHQDNSHALQSGLKSFNPNQSLVLW
jgi:hypothetical protein